MRKLTLLSSAVEAHVEPGMHLHFASTPSRSNAAVLAVARAFRGRTPGFTISATGFHSLLHLLPMLRLGRRYLSCFFGDNYPIPRPNELYTQLHADGADLESWSLWSYVSSLRAGALGNEWAINRSFPGTTLGAELERLGKYRSIEPLEGLIAGMRSEVTFLHAPFGDETGRAVFSPPYSEAFWGALGARRGAIITVERIVAPAIVDRFLDDVKIPPDRVLAICQEPFGAHPQPLYAQPRFEQDGYRDDFEHYELWRLLSRGGAPFDHFSSRVLDGPPDQLGARYREFVGDKRLRELTADAAVVQASGTPPPRKRWSRPSAPRLRVPTPAEGFRAASRENEILILLAARKIADRVQAGGYRTILAGIGHGFMASRIAKLLLLERGVEVKVMVETGLYDLECGPHGHEFPLAYDNIALAKRLSDVEEVLGTLTCGADNGCLGVLGAAQIDERGDINTTRLAGGKQLVGSGGGNDIAALAAEVLVLTRHTTTRLVPRVDYVTSTGRRVATIVTNLCAFKRDGNGWRLGDIYPAYGGAPIQKVLDEVKKGCPWRYRVPDAPEYAPQFSTAEMMLVHTLDRQGLHWEREAKR